MSGQLRDQQFALTRHLRDPLHAPAPAALEARRVQIYRDLLFNNLQALLGSSFPVLLQLLEKEEWDAVCRRYFIEHRCASPLFTEVAAEFVEWLQLQDALPRPFLAELAHYEWVELALQSRDAHPLRACGTDVDPWQSRLQRSPLAWPLAYHWPVQQIGVAFQPTTAPPEPTFLLARRVADGRIVFSQLSPLAWQLLTQLEAAPPRSGATHLRQLADDHGLDPVALEAPGRALLAQLLASGVIGPAARPAGG
ncbi:putative DNA-binding domain-containing protein [Stenotrophomonas sp. ISL-67]|uniref:HvfC family RiPP maturation protein n=1 Tax=Stenotrophomonas sp. ISL-67 TaxID=2819171 RepID=UPI001BE6BB3D|nr:putative DNA-binding domain-containing protein [Stenotrophomonas sp. ISL-67]MBT2766478.1 putative DNA-binding domain-containing protein [Stenotrophomonas sp. ISL-67]